MTGVLMPFFTFFGGKWRAAPLYPAPAHDLVVEPFAGSAGYSVRYHERDVLLVDADPAIVATWRFLISADPDFIRSLPLTLEEGQKVRDLGLPEGADHIIGWWLNKGMVSPCQTPSKWMRDGWRPKSMWGPEIRERIASQVPKIRHWQVRQGSYVDVENQTATWFVDPPYQQAGRKYRHSSKLLDFAHLADWCKSRQGQLMVCENEGADWLPFRPFANTKASEGRHKTSAISREVIYP